MERFWHPDLAKLNSEEINWDTPRAVPCTECKRLGVRWPPSTGSYASSLGHYERILKNLPQKREGLRLMLVFLDPRPIERGFVACHPLNDPALLSANDHRYFCLTPSAWRDLRLHEEPPEGMGRDSPCWPSGHTAHLYLRRYFSGDSWSYDGFIAYFISLFRPGGAYITNLAKCHFGGHARVDEVYAACMQRHLSRELDVFRPTVMLTFSRRFDAGALAELVGNNEREPKAVLRVYHPAARKISPRQKIRRFESAIAENRTALETLGCDVTDILDQWKRDSERAAQWARGNDMPREQGLTLRRGPMSHHILKEIHDMRAVPASPPHPCDAHYLMVCADVLWPHDPRRKHRVFTIIMQYSKREGEEVRYWPAHILPDDADSVFREFDAFVKKNRASD